LKIGEWSDDVYENPPPKEPVSKELIVSSLRKEIKKVRHKVSLID
jgi:hypothetical protein